MADFQITILMGAGLNLTYFVLLSFIDGSFAWFVCYVFFIAHYVLLADIYWQQYITFYLGFLPNKSETTLLRKTDRQNLQRSGR